MSCNHCNRENCEVYAEDGGITAICSVTGKIIDMPERDSDIREKRTRRVETATELQAAL